jgi:hypothetical protein
MFPSDSEPTHSLSDSSEITFSVIIPLECHRGQTERCLQGWMQNQSYPRHLYEVVVVAPDHIPPHELESLKPLFTDQDRLLVRPERHDIALCAAAAHDTSGKVLFFTESHCWPEPDVLEKVAIALHTHPEWVGLSCRSIPVTHNPLSLAEASMYRSDIEYGMLHHPWRKVLDQCFAVHRHAYFLAGGFEASLGHYSEWMLGVRFWHLGMKIGYEPTACIHHYYVGELAELKEFTLDFTQGEMSIQARTPRDPCADFMPQTLEWNERHRWNRTVAAGMAKVLWGEFWSQRRRFADRSNDAAKWIHWIFISVAGVLPAWTLALLKSGIARLHLWWRMHVLRDQNLTDVFQEYIAALIHLGRMDFLLRAADRFPNPQPWTSEWRPDGGDNMPKVGFHLLEEWNGQPFRWSEPVALMQIPIESNIPCEVIVELLPLFSFEDLFDTRFYWNGRLLPRENADWGSGGVTVKLPKIRGSHGFFAWSCPQFLSSVDARALGMPTRRIFWRSHPSNDTGPV